jgi:hypothetical protein
MLVLALVLVVALIVRPRRRARETVRPADHPGPAAAGTPVPAVEPSVQRAG